MKILAPTVMLLILTACSNVPVTIKNAPSPDLQLTQLNGKVSAHQGEKVRWGGQIVKVENTDKGSTLHIAQFPLNSFGRPNIEANSQGRFLAHSNDFIDPYIYAKDTRVTITGLIAKQDAITVDKKTMTVPVVQITDIYRWTVSSYDRDPYWRGYPYYYDHFGYGVSYPRSRSHWHYGRGFYW